jgi:primosomal protein N' (replication factor Y)
VSGVQVVVDVPLFHLDRPFTYRVPESLRDAVRLGSRVKVPFGARRRVDGWVVGFTDELPPGARDLIRLVSPLPVFGPRELALLRWVADRWAGTLSDVLRLAVPPRVAAVEKALAEPDGGGGSGGLKSEAATQAAGGHLEPSVSPPVNNGGEAAGPPGEAIVPPRDQLTELVASGWRGAVLWRPLPGEDRGARVVALVEAALAAGRGALVITPELAAGSDVGDAVRKSFPDAADLSSDLPDRRRYRAWAELRAGRRQVAVGGRSAVLAPVRRLGLVVVDDEANRAHKEQRTPRYHARDVALLRAAVDGATCVLSGTVPSAEAVAALRAGRVRLLAPDRAAERRARPLVEVVDPFDQDSGPGAAGLHRRAMAAVEAAVGRGESAYVLVPRRGPAQPGAPRLRTAGQVAEELARHLGASPVWRLDREVLDPGEVPPWAGSGHGVIVGTVAGVKDHPPLTGCRTVVVVGADAALGQAEVRAAEEAYRTWSRAAVWCGPQGGAGRFVLQAREGAHHAVQALVRWDPAYFWRHELPRRVELGFPPARRLVLVEGQDMDEAKAAMMGLQDALGPKAELLGPAEMGRGWRIIAKVEDAESAARALRPMLAEASRSGGPHLSVDVEPLEVLAPAPAGVPAERPLPG